MQINVTVDGLDAIDLNTVVGQRDRYDDDLDQRISEDITIGGEVARRIANKLTKDDSYPGLRQRFLDIRTEEIREAVKPLVTDAINAAIELTNGFGERTGQATSMRELVIAEARKLLTERSDYGRGTTLAQRIVAEEIGRAFQAELSKTIAAEKEKVVVAVRAKAAELIADAVAKGIGR